MLATGLHYLFSLMDLPVALMMSLVKRSRILHLHVIFLPQNTSQPVCILDLGSNIKDLRFVFGFFFFFFVFIEASD